MTYLPQGRLHTRKCHKLIHGTFGPRYDLFTIGKVTHAQVPRTWTWNIRPSAGVFAYRLYAKGDTRIPFVKGRVRAERDGEGRPSEEEEE